MGWGIEEHPSTGPRPTKREIDPVGSSIVILREPFRRETTSQLRALRYVERPLNLEPARGRWWAYLRPEPEPDEP